MWEGRRSVVFGLVLLALGSLVGAGLTVGQQARLRQEMRARGPISVSGLTRGEFDAVVDLVYLQGLVVFVGLAVVSLVLARGHARDKPWATFWTVPVCVAVLLYSVAGFAGDVVTGRARPALVAAAVVAAAVLLRLGRRSGLSNSVPADAASH